MTETAFIPNFFKLYNMLWKAALPFLRQNKRLKGEFEKRVQANHFQKADIWIQAASAGEAYLAVQMLKTFHPLQKTSILLTTTTAQGKEILESGVKKARLDANIQYQVEWFPFDIPKTAQKAVQKINPKVMVLLETEIWPALIHHLKKNNTQIFIANARMSDKSFKIYMATRFLWRHLRPHHVFATSIQDKKKYETLFKGAKANTISNIKFDCIEDNAVSQTLTKEIRQLIGSDTRLSILASIRKQEEKKAVRIIKDILAGFPGQVVGLFPRHMHRIDAWKRHLANHGISYQLKSDTTGLVAAKTVILWDTFGELKSACSIADVAFVGGSLVPLGGQNFIEPAIQGCATITGPFWDDFFWVKENIFHQKIVTKVANAQEVSKEIISHLHQPGSREKRKAAAIKFIQAHQGGTQKVCDAILKIL
ncbi:MAG: 3-deoxy-D-manno-octulosonic acid transferase [Desulfobacteraceae bacterium]|nr:3-deoxy-D-manno-octulosonic acid transferase [Desulfobacteraceae bacterium]